MLAGKSYDILGFERTYVLTWSVSLSGDSNKSKRSMLLVVSSWGWSFWTGFGPSHSCISLRHPLWNWPYFKNSTEVVSRPTSSPAMTFFYINIFQWASNVRRRMIKRGDVPVEVEYYTETIAFQTDPWWPPTCSKWWTRALGRSYTQQILIPIEDSQNNGDEDAIIG